MKRLFCIFSFGIFLGIGLIAFAEISDDVQLDPHGFSGTVSLKKGWNLVPIYYQDLGWGKDERLQASFAEQVRAKGIGAGFFYNRYAKAYIRTVPSGEFSKMADFANQMGDPERGGDIREYGGFVNSAAWIYADRDQAGSLNTIDGPLFLKYVRLKTGWNFLTVTPEMVGWDLDHLAGSCKIQKDGFWDADTQRWDVGGYTKRDFSERELWKGFVLKVAEDCFLSSPAAAPPSPPALP